MSTLEITYNSFINRISGVTKKDILLKLFQKALLFISAFVLLALLLTGLEAIFGFSSPARKIIFYAFFSSLSAAIVLILINTLLNYKDISKPRKINSYAKQIGSHFPDIKDNLLNALQVYTYTKKGRHIFSTSLAAETIKQVDEKSRKFDFKSIISFKKANPFILFFSFSLLLFTLLLFTLPSLLNASGRLVNYNYTFIENTLGVAYEVSPGNIEIPKGESVEVYSKVLFNDPNYSTAKINLCTKTITNDGIEISSSNSEIESSGTNEFKSTIKSINSNTIYWFEYKGIKSSSYTITITARPVIKSTKITVYPPAYTRLPSREIDGTEIVTIAGSKIYVQVESSDELEKSFLQFSSGSNLQVEISDKTATGTFSASSNGTFKIFLENKKGLTNQNVPEYTMRVIPDEYPAISIVEPEDSKSVQGLKDIVIRSRISDDFGFTKLRIAYKLSKSKFGPVDKDFHYIDVPFINKDATGVEVPYAWNLSSLNLGTEDEVEYFAEVYDNDAVSGPKMTRSEIKKLVYPSLEALMDKTEKTKEEIEKSLNDALEDAMELKKELDEIKEKLETNPEELGLNDPKKNEELQKKIENIQNQFSNTEKKMNDLMNDLKNQNQVSQETLEKYMELQQLFKKIDSKELRDMMAKLQETLKNFNKQQLEEAMKNFKFDEEAFKKAMEKTMELLQKILNEQKFGELTQTLDDITKKQDALKNETEQTDKNDRQKMNEESKTQDQLKKELQDFQKQTKELTENMNKLDKNDQVSKELQKMLAEMMKKMLEQKMENSSKNLQDGKKNESMQQQKELSEELNKFNMQMQQQLESMLNSANMQAMKKMMEYLERLQKMSAEQQELKEKSEELDKNSPGDEYKQNQKEQQKLQNDLSGLIDEMMAMGEQMGMNPMMSKNLGDAYNDMQNATEKLGKKEGPSANKFQGSAKENLDKAIERMQQMCQNGMSGKGNKPSSSLQQLLQMLQQMIQRQQALMQKMDGMGLNGNQGKLNQEQMAEMQRMAQEQETIKKNLQQLNEEFKKEQEKEGKKLLGNLEEVQKDMMEVLKDMQDGNITPETRKRQEKILSRMLDFQLSAREKDFEQRRESRPGKNFERSSPPEVVISRPNIINGINQDALILQQDNFSEDYETLIQKFKEKLKQVK
ncbi:MAG TPA: DUF4175 family protein [Ignavibacteria bacterium]|nr:DUF4175 family protein [Ignavibacteria bacterium]